MSTANLVGATCEEASILSTTTYIPCGKPARYMISNGDPKLYFMCDACADHNVRNRGARVVVRSNDQLMREEKTR